MSRKNKKRKKLRSWMKELYGDLYESYNSTTKQTSTKKSKKVERVVPEFKICPTKQLFE